MARFRIVAARPKNASNHANSQFRMFQWNATETTWTSIGWKTIGEVSDFMTAGHEVLTGKIIDGKMNKGAAVELELRIAKNDSQYKISEMPET